MLSWAHTIGYPSTGKSGSHHSVQRPKRDSQDRQIILDLSFPPGESVNDGMVKDNYMGAHLP